MRIRHPAAGLSLLEVLIVCLLSLLVIAGLAELVHIALRNNLVHQQRLQLQQRLWLVDNTLHSAIETAGVSAAYPSNPAAWQALTKAPAFQLYQSEAPLPPVLAAHWRDKLLAHSTILETGAIQQPQFVQDYQGYRIDIAAKPIAQVGEQWLVTSTTAWQLLTVAKVLTRADGQILAFSTPLSSDLQPPLLAGPYRHGWWFVAIDKGARPRGTPSYGLYQWEANSRKAPQEIASGISLWRGEVVAAHPASPASGEPIRALIEWQLGFTAGQQQMSEKRYFVYTART